VNQEIFLAEEIFLADEEEEEKTKYFLPKLVMDVRRGIKRTFAPPPGDWD